MSTIELNWTDRVIGGAQTPRRFLDFVVDGKAMYDRMGDLISPLGWFSFDSNRKVINRLLLIDPADFPDNRRSIYVCPECADLGCGAVAAVIESVGQTIVWRDFGYENNYDENILFDEYRDIGPFVFYATEYSNVISRAPVNS